MKLQNTKQFIQTKIQTSATVLFVLISALVLLVPQITPAPAGAETIDELQEKSNQLQAEISANNEIIDDLAGLADTLQGKVDQLNAEISAANKKIEKTEVVLAELAKNLQQAEIELDKRKQLLKATLQAIYERKGASTLELLLATDSFTDFLNEQEYLGQLQTAVKTATEEVVALKQQIEAEKATQEALLKDQENQRNIVASKRKEQQDLLDQTEGEEAKYRNLVASQLDELEAAEAELAALLAAGSFVSYGPVTRGAKVGEVGSTGFSTGPHIHFQVYRNGVTQNPSAGGSSIINGYEWPLAGGVGYISQAYGCVAPPWYYSVSCNGGSGSFHSGLDIAATAYTPVIAVDDGEIIFRGCRAGLGYVVVIEHSGGWQTWYPHMITPEGQVYGYC